MKHSNRLTVKFSAAIVMIVVAHFSNIFAQPDANKYAALRQLFEQKQYAEVLKTITPIIETESKNTTDSNKATLAELYLLRGASRIAFLYRGRTGTVLGSYAPVERPLFEVKYNPETTQILDGAIADLTRAIELEKAVNTKTENGFTSTSFSTRNREIVSFRALAHLEKGQFITNNPSDFAAAFGDFYELELKKNVELVSAGNYTDAATKKAAQDDWKKEGYLLAAQLRALVISSPNADGGRPLYDKWSKSRDASVKPEIALVSMVEALDMAGYYGQARAVILKAAYDQYLADGGKFVPDNQARNKEAFKRHLSDLSFAGRIAVSETLLPFERARLAGALFLKKGEMTETEAQFAFGAYERILKDPANFFPTDTIILTYLIAFGSDKAGLNEITRLQSLTNLPGAVNSGYLKAAPVILGKSALSSQITPDKKTDALRQGVEFLTKAIEDDEFLAFAFGAHRYRAQIYKLQSKFDLAAKDEQKNTRLAEILNFLAQP